MEKGATEGGWKRTLYYFPIIHTQADMGELGEAIQHSTLQELGRVAWQRKLDTVARMWTSIERFIDGLDLVFESVRIYQDGLPVCGKEVDIIKNLAGRGSRNHQLLLRLMNKGATVMGTESSELLVEEYRLIKKLMVAGDSPQPARGRFEDQARSRELLRKRNQFIAARINGTLASGETGLLFLGMLHSLENLLARDIRVIPVPPIEEGVER
jgi:hypothetical protein